MLADERPVATPGAPRQLLIVCTANIARSPSADLLARRLLQEQPGRSPWYVGSAGIQAIPGAGIDETMGTELRRYGIDPAAHRSTQLVRSAIERADLVLTFERRHRRWILGECPDASRRVFTIRRAAALLAERPKRADAVDFLAADDQATTDSDDFADPYGQGPEAARVAVAEIDRLLRVIVPAITA